MDIYVQLRQFCCYCCHWSYVYMTARFLFVIATIGQLVWAHGNEEHIRTRPVLLLSWLKFRPPPITFQDTTTSRWSALSSNLFSETSESEWKRNRETTHATADIRCSSTNLLIVCYEEVLVSTYMCVVQFLQLHLLHNRTYTNIIIPI